MQTSSIKQTNGIISVDQTFATLQRITDQDYQFAFRYAIDQRRALKLNCTYVMITVMAKFPSSQTMSKYIDQSSFDADKIVSVLRSRINVARTSAQRQLDQVIARVNSDFTSKVNNDQINQLTSDLSSREISSLATTKTKLIKVSDVNQGVDVKPVIYVSNISEQSTLNDVKSLSRDLLFKYGVDPSTVTDTQHVSQASDDSLSGVSLRSRRPQNDEINLLRDHYISVATSKTRKLGASSTLELQNDDYVEVIFNEVNDVLDIDVAVDIPIAAINNYVSRAGRYVSVKFELIDNTTKLSVDTIEMELDVLKHRALRATPLRRPVVSYAIDRQTSSAVIEIKQLDEFATGVRLYKKTINKSSVDVFDYVLIADVPLKFGDQPALVPITVPTDDTLVCRCVSYGEDSTMGHEFTNVVINTQTYSPDVAVALTAHKTSRGVDIIASNFPVDAISLTVKAKDLTVTPPLTEIVDDVVFINDAIRSQGSVTVVHVPVTNHVYEYQAYVTYSHGIVRPTNVALIEALPKEAGKIDVKVKNLTVIRGITNNVQFDVSIDVSNSDTDDVARMLERQGIIDYYKKDLDNQKDSFKSLLAYAVQRIDMTTGDVADYGVITQDSFDDVALQNRRSISALRAGHKYRYEITPLIRTSETLLEKLTKTVTDSETKKTYTFLPSKFLHPEVLKSGVLRSSIGFRYATGLDAMQHGRIGDVIGLDVSLVTTDVDSSPLISQSTAVRFDRLTNVVDWNVSGDVSQIDHFIIAKEISNVRTLVGRVHSEFSSGNCKFIHKLTKRDRGALRYLIFAVLNDYTIIQASQTNVVLIEDIF